MEIIGYKEHLDQVAEEFPDVDKKAVASVIRHGLAMLGIFKRMNMDIFLNHNHEKFYFYFGKVTKGERNRQINSDKKIRTKVRMMYRINKTQYSGYYYFGLTDAEHALAQEGKPIERVLLWKIQAECKVFKMLKHYYRLPVEVEEGWCIPKYNYETNDAEYLYSRVKDGSESTHNAEQCTD